MIRSCIVGVTLSEIPDMILSHNTPNYMAENAPKPSLTIVAQERLHQYHDVISLTTRYAGVNKVRKVSPRMPEGRFSLFPS